MVKSFAPLAISTALLVAAVSSASLPDGTWPKSTGTVQYSTAYTVKAGEVFDGKMQTFERSDISCLGQEESGKDTAVFLVEAGGHLKNVIIGANQMEGVHCDQHDCIIENVWWDDVCEDALSVKGGSASSVTKVIGGGARSADDKVIQHNGYGTVQIDGFYGEDISKLYRSCGTCGNRPKKVEVSNVYVVNPGNAIVTVNKNWGDQATLKNIWVQSSKKVVKICQWSQGNADGEPTIVGHGPSGKLCQYSESDVHINQDIPKTGGSSPSTSTSAPSTSSDGSNTSQTQTTQAPDTSASTGSNGQSENGDQTIAKSSSGSSSSNTTETDSSVDTSGVGTVAPAGNFEQSIVDSGSSNSPEQGSTNAPSASSSSSSPTTDVSQTDVQFSSSASIAAGSDNEAQNEIQTDAPSTNSSTASSSSSPSQSAPTNSTGSVPDGKWPTSKGTIRYAQPYTVKAGEVFDGKMKTYERSDITCEGQTESGWRTAVFLVEAGGTLKNVIIGKNQMEGVHCDQNDCTIENVWWDDVCEDALSIKGGSASSVTKIIGGGARSADDKVIQHNGYGTVKIDGFYAANFGKLYRSCGTCGNRPKKVILSNILAVDPKVSIVTVNKNYNDQAILTNIHVKSSKPKVKVCQWSQGGPTPTNLGDGPSGTLCQYSESDIHINDVLPTSVLDA
ncbi:hypothetical protein BBO99_00007530 [Phytophthora kernoviae]|uniref:Probable pectate lyase F n=2 Tax=Phytophthora kernoviae TaxID=325452 RepID=A0A3R7GN13_9STRA|nr:hypothetical protein G195_008424 [Phytophthora kernoviae 00238/432]KAG2520521.1 hypothetical protein JM18_007065 [Phytophthora kernoviae]RLN21092.1 hypothetical protein BBI17_007850 [Phytophthora kernoviae]RLN76483.1 hypothetical protein BBO99_00007530 [Phytophthora kernoviae]